MQFESFDFHSSISANIARLGYETPTPIQREAIPHVLEGRDVMGLAQTGTGKTAAFLLPIIDRFLKNPRPLRGSARALVIAPTRELAEQIHESARDYARGLKFRSVTVYGGVGMGPQAGNLRRGADIVVACPGRLLDHLNQGNANLSGVEVLVLDEADHMFDMGFLPDIKRILAAIPAERQTLLFSATMPESIKGLAGETLKEPAVVRIGRTAPAQTIEQCMYPVAPHLKTKLLLELLGEMDEGSTLVFTRTKHRAKRLAEQLCRMGHASACLQGNLSQAQRQKAMDGFRTGKYRVLVATDIAARGIDVSRVAHVVNYDLPDTPETYTHRVGRTGRAEREGRACSLITSEDVSMVKAIERILGKAIERRRMQGFDYAAAAPERDREFERPPLPARGQGRGGAGGRQMRASYGEEGRDSRPAAYDNAGGNSGSRTGGRNYRDGGGRDMNAEGRSSAGRERAYAGRDGASGNSGSSDNSGGRSGYRQSSGEKTYARRDAIAAESRGRDGGNRQGASRDGASTSQRGNREGNATGQGRRFGGETRERKPFGGYDGQADGNTASGRPRREPQGERTRPAGQGGYRKDRDPGSFYGYAAMDEGKYGNRYPAQKPDVEGNRHPDAKPDVNGNTVRAQRQGRPSRPRQGGGKAA